jgi:hypothetical protein
MLLRQAATLPILPMHLDTAECRAADEIVRAARAECSQPRHHPKTADSST